MAMVGTCRTQVTFLSSGVELCDSILQGVCVYDTVGLSFLWLSHVWILPITDEKYYRKDEFGSQAPTCEPGKAAMHL